MHSPRTTPTAMQRQRGAVFIVMLVVMIMGVTFFLVSALSKTSMQLERNRQTADALAQAKDALIGRAASAPNVPGSLPCPDINNDGISEGVAGNCTSYVGRLPWKTLGLPDLRDASGERLWYALSVNFRDNSAAHINSDTTGTITVFAPDGTLLNDGTGSTGAVALVIAPGDVLTRQGGTQQDRSSAGTNSPPNYLDIATVAGNTQDNANFTGSSSSTNGFILGRVKDSNDNIIVNDQILVITRDQLLPVVETRIAREVRSCLDSYALGSSNMYPWATPVANAPLSTGIQNTLFGRISSTPDTSVTTSTTTYNTTYNTTYYPISSSNDPNFNSVSSALSNLQNAVTSCASSDGGSNPSNLYNAAAALNSLIGSLPNPPYSTSLVTNANSASNTAAAPNACQNIENNSNYSSIQTNLTSAQSTLNGLTVAVTTATTTPTTTTTTVQAGSPAWQSGCFVSGTYWDDWKNLVFYQVDDKYKPGGTPSTPSITINGSGNYRAAVILSRRPTGSPAQIRITTDATTYLEGINPHTATTPALTFETYKLIDQPTTNDLVFCLDGKTSGNCQ